MNDDVVEMYQAEPLFESRGVNILRWLIGLALSYGPLFLALISWYLTNWYIGLSSWPLFYLLLGIVSSKIRHIFVPPTQREHSYTAYELASWILAFYFESKRAKDAAG